ncbi:MAG: Hsp20/alpha crystallin family protein [Actinobacteria bacterium]|nr:MAG: Hsp20/alpha crystallin family protein [Actinomycetota bacterium]
MASPVLRSETAPSRPPQRWEPLRELEQLHEQMGRLMEGVWTPIGEGNGGTWIPLADIEETDDAWIIEAELPSVDRKDINVELRDNELVITGEIKEKERKGVLRRRTRRKGQFEYRVTLPGHPREEGIEANLHEGVLTVRVPKAEQERPRRIDVTAA